MARLKSIGSHLRTVPVSRLKVPQGRVETEAHRDRQSWRAWYKTAEWRALRLRVAMRFHYVCQWPGCGRVAGGKGEGIADHWRPHRGDAKLFWDESNIKWLCKPCHDGPKAAAEARGEFG